MSNPVVPSTAVYPLSDLNLFPTAGPGPSFDPTQPQKAWSDPVAVELVAVGDGNVSLPYGSYQVQTPGADPVWTPFSLPASVAANVNLPSAAQEAAANQAGEPTLALPGYSGIGAIPQPQRQTLSTESIFSAGIPGSTSTSWSVGNTTNGYVVPGTPVVSTNPNDARVLAGINALLTFFKLPTV